MKNTVTLEEKLVTLDHNAGLKGQVFYDEYPPTALRRALEFAGEEGLVASLPQLTWGRITTPVSPPVTSLPQTPFGTAYAERYDGIWTHWFTALSEFNYCATPKGNFAVVVHGGGVLSSSPEKFEEAYQSSPTRSEGRFPLTDKEVQDLLNGKLPGGREIKAYTFEELLREESFPPQYAVVLDQATAEKRIFRVAEFFPGLQTVLPLYFEPLSRQLGFELKNPEETIGLNPPSVALFGSLKLVEAYAKAALSAYQAPLSAFLQHFIVKTEAGNLEFSGITERAEDVDPSISYASFIRFGGGLLDGNEGIRGPPLGARFVAVQAEALATYKASQTPLQ